MPFTAKSPSVQILEQDVSGYTTTTANTILALVGYATKGPLNTIKSVSSKSDFIKLFGNPSSTSPWGALTALRAFNQTNQVLFYRVGNPLGATGSGDSTVRLQYAERVISGYTQAGTADSSRILFQAEEYGSAFNGSYITITQRTNPLNGDSIFDWRFYYNGSLVETYQNINFRKADSRFYSTLINADPSNGGSSWVSVVVKYSNQSPNLARLVPFGTAGTVNTFYLGQANGVGDSRSASVGRGDTYSAIVGASTYYQYRIGRDGILLNSGDTLFTNALATTGVFANKEVNDFHIVAVPDNGNSGVADALVALVENRTDALALIDPPFGKSVANVVNWHNGTGSQGRTSVLNSSYAATWWPWLKDFNSISGQYLWAPPSEFIAEKLLQVDANWGPWYAPAGDVRGKITAYDYESSPSQSDRDQLYGDLNAINPIVNFAGKGLEVYGQKTLLRSNTALNRLNVRRMVIYVKKLIKKAMDSIVFEPNTTDSWSRARTIINSILEPVRQANGLADYKVTIDSTTTTPDLIAQNIMNGIIQIVPVGAIEIIQLTLQIKPAGSTIT
jgi:hypothetical protein